MKKLTMRTVGAASAAGTALLLMAGSAWASPPYGVSVGGDSSPGSYSFSNSVSPVLWTMQDSTTYTMGCTNLQVAGTVTTGASGVNPYLELTSWSFNGCTGPGGNLRFTQTGTAFLYGTTPATPALVDDIDSYLGSIQFHVATTPLASVCNYDIVGGFSADFDEPTQTLTLDETGFTGNLTLVNVSGCGGQLHDGDPVDMAFSFSPAVTGDINLFG
jgi:hypothetical protein